MKHLELGSKEVICQKWEELERDWGARPDGFSLHISIEGLKRYIDAYWETMPEEAPDEYSQPDGEAYPVGVSEDVYGAVVASGYGLRFHSNTQYPGSGGIDGWQPVTI